MLDSALRRLEESGADAPDFRRGGTVRPIVDTERGGRYLVEAYKASVTQAQDPSIVLYILEVTSAQVAVSIPYTVPVTLDVMNPFNIVSLDDVDGDGLGDVAYCRWPGGQDEPGIGSVVAFKDQTWYAIARPRRVQRACRE